MLTPLNSIFGESLFDDIFGDFTRPAKNLVRYNAQAPSVMKTDIKESDAGYELEIDLPGYRKENVKAELKEGYLTISAESRQENSQKDDAGKYIRRERYYGTCSRSFYVGDEVTEQDIKARFEDGILKVAIPKKEARPAVEESRFIAIEG